MSLLEKLIWNPRHAREAAGGRPDLGREVGQGADVVAEGRRGPRELAAGQLHAVAGIAGEPDRDAIQFLLVDRLLGGLDLGGHAPSGCSIS